MLVCVKGMLKNIKKDLSLRLKTRVSVVALSSLGSLFQTQGPAAEKSRSPSLSLVDCLIWSLLLAERFAARPDTDALVARRFCR